MILNILYIIASYIICTIVHEIGHLLTMLVLKIELVTFNAYPITIYKKEDKYKFKISYKNLFQGYCLPKFGIINNEKELDISTKKLIIISLMGPITSFLFAFILYYLYGLNSIYLIIMSVFIGVSTLLFSDGLMTFKLLKSEEYKISTLLYFQQDVNEDISYLFNYACDISKEFNITDRFFYLDKENKEQIFLQKLIIFYSLIYNFEINNKLIYTNYNKIKDMISSFKYINSNLFEYINLWIINDILTGKNYYIEKEFNFIKDKGNKKDQQIQYIKARTEYFIKKVKYKEVLLKLPQIYLYNKYCIELEEKLLQRNLFFYSN